MAAILDITDGTTRVHLLKGAGARVSGYYLADWTPSTPDLKGGGVYQDSPLADGRRLVAGQYTNAVETFKLHARGSDEDNLIRELQDLRRLLIQSDNYWRGWQPQPVWIEARGACETNKRYALIMRGVLPQDKSPYKQPWIGKQAIANELTLYVERGHWQDTEPMTGVCAEASAVQELWMRQAWQIASVAPVSTVESMFKTSTGRLLANDDGGAWDIWHSDDGVTWAGAGTLPGVLVSLQCQGSDGFIYGREVSTSTWRDENPGALGTPTNGLHWRQMSAALGPFSMVWFRGALYAVDPDPTRYSNIYKSTNGGATWSVIYNEPTFFFETLAVTNEPAMYVVASVIYTTHVFFVMRSVDGITWSIDSRLLSGSSLGTSRTTLHTYSDGSLVVAAPYVTNLYLRHGAGDWRICSTLRPCTPGGIFDFADTTDGYYWIVLNDIGATDLYKSLDLYSWVSVTAYLPGGGPIYSLAEGSDENLYVGQNGQIGRRGVTAPYGNTRLCGPAYLDFNGDTSSINCGSNATLDDIPDFAVAAKGNITAEAWIKPDTWGEANAGRIFSKTNWSLRLDSALGLYSNVVCAAQTAISDSGLDEFTLDGEWHHVLMTYSEVGLGTAVARTIYLAIDGVWVATYPTQQVSAGNYTSDAAQNLFIGNNAGGAACFDGKIGWTRISSTIRYDPAANFTPEPRCTIPPTIDANVQGSWIYEGSGATAHDMAGVAARDGAITDGTWACDCTTDLVPDPTCENEVYIANKRNVAQLTDIYVYDTSAAAYTANLIGSAVPHNLLPWIPAVGDYIIFGIQSALPDSGPFNNLVLDIGQALNATTWTIVWRYSDVGVVPTAWAALGAATNWDLHDGTASFGNTGVNSIHWKPPSDFVPLAVNGVTCYWVCAHLTAIAAAVAPPTQANRNIYTCNWPSADIDASQVTGDLTALDHMFFVNRSDHDGPGGASTSLDAWADRVVCGLRSVDRGSQFTAVLNCADEQNPIGVTVTLGANSAFAAASQSPTGRRVDYTGTVLSQWTDECIFELGPGIARDFYGSYHAYLRAQQTMTALGSEITDIRVRLKTVSGSGGIRHVGDWVNFQVPSDAGVFDTGSWQVLDLGPCSLPVSAEFTPNNLGERAWFTIQMWSSAARVVKMYDLWLIPTDEWAGDFCDVAFEDDSCVENGYQLNMDSVTLPKVPIRSLVQNTSTWQIRSVYQDNTPGPAILQPNADQRMWFFAMRGIAQGTCDAGGSGTLLVDTAASFLTQGVKVGMEAYNLTDGVSALIEGMTATTLTTRTLAGAATWTATDTYYIICPNWRAEPWICHSVNFERVARYLSMRGAR